MIPRYSRKEIASIWSDENKYQIWLDIEKHACQAQAQLGIIPANAAKNIQENVSFDIERINSIEKSTHHDVISFLTSVAEHVGEDSRFIHYGMTSSDIVDTSLAVQLKQSTDVILKDLETLLDILKKRAEETKYLICMGRSHGIHAEPITFGLKFTRFYAEFRRNYNRLLAARDEISVCMISGPMGTFANIDPFVEEYVAQQLGLQPEPISSQIIPRDRHAMLFSVFGIIASSIENIAIEIRNLQRTEVGEVSEFFSDKQKGSSAMPHKRNPILSENLTGLARIIRSCVNPALEDIALWNERDISHSSVERYIAPNACITLDFALARLAHILDNLKISQSNIDNNMQKLRGLTFSQQVLLALIQNGASREDAYKIVQRNAAAVWENPKLNFYQQLKSDNEAQIANLDELFDLQHHIKYVDLIFQRVFEAG